VGGFEQDGAVALHDRRIAGLYRHGGHTPMEVAVRVISTGAIMMTVLALRAGDSGA
jgi:hypothetical protein